MTTVHAPYLPSVEAPKPADIDTLPENDALNFLEINSIIALRQAEYRLKNEALISADTALTGLTSAEVKAEVAGELPSLFDELVHDYTAQFIPEDHPKFDIYVDHLRSFGIDKMTAEELNLGHKDPATGTRSEPGWLRAHDFHTAEHSADADIPLTTQEQLVTATATMEQSRFKYAKALAGDVKGFTRAFRSSANNEQLANARRAWEAAMNEFARLYGEKANTERPAGMAQEDWQAIISGDLMAGMCKEYKALEEAKVNTIEGTKTWKVVNWMAKGGTIKRFMKSAGIGIGVGILSVPLGIAGGAVGMSALVVGGAVGVTRFVRGYAGWESRKPTARELIARDTAHMDSALSNVGELSDDDYKNLSAEDIMKRAVIIANRLETKSGKEAKKGMRKSAAVGLGMVATGAFTGSLIHAASGRIGIGDWMHDHLPWNHDNAPTRPNAGGNPVDTNPNGPGGHGLGVGSNEVPSTGGGNQILTTGLDQAAIDRANLIEIAHNNFLNAHGQFPWSRAVDAFGGDKSAATDWIKQAAIKAGGEWHNAGTPNAWLEVIDPKTGLLTSNVDVVWNQLVQASFA